MKKKIMAFFVTVMMCLSLCGLLSVNAEESVSAFTHSTGLIEESLEELAERTGTQIINTSARATAEDLPSSVDNSTNGKFFPPIGNQGEIGSCVGWATTYYQFTYEVNRFKNESTTLANRYSPSWTYNYTNQGIDEGSNLSDAYNVLNRQGAMKLTDYPHNNTVATYSFAWSSDVVKMTEALEYRAKLTTYSAVNSSQLYNVKKQLANGHVGVITTHSDGWVIVENDDGQKVIVCGADGDSHAVAVVGYDNNIQVTVNGVTLTGAFKLANSWGSSWGNKGYMWVAYDALNTASEKGTAWQNDTNNVLKTADGRNYSSSMRNPIFNTGNGFSFIDIYHCPITFAGYIEYRTTDPCALRVYANEENAVTNIAWDIISGQTLESAEKRTIVFDYFQFDSTSNGETFYEGAEYDMSGCLSSNWKVQVYDDSAPAALYMRTRVIDNFGNVVHNALDSYTKFVDGKVTLTTNVNLAKGRVTAYDNGPITSEDSAMVLDYTIELIEFSNVQAYLADYNSDGVISTLDVIEMNQAIAAQSGQSYAITDYIEEWGCSLADVIEEQYDMPIEQYVAENYAELSALDVIPAEMELEISSGVYA